MAGIKERLQVVRDAMDNAAKKTGRSLKDITLVAVTKGVPPERIAEAREAGLLLFGENRVQEAEAKIPLTQPGAEWHMVGHLQTNKIKPALSLFSLIQSVDSARLAKAIDDESQAQGKITSVLLEVNISGEKQKFGFNPEEIYGALESVSVFQGIRVLGLMGIAPNTPDEAPKREAFKKLRSVFSVCKTLKYPNVEMKHLSMGMTDDFQIAIEEGSNMVRLGRALFGER